MGWYSDVLSLWWESLSLERRSLYWNRIHVSHHHKEWKMTFDSTTHLSWEDVIWKAIFVTECVMEERQSWLRLFFYHFRHLAACQNFHVEPDSLVSNRWFDCTHVHVSSWTYWWHHYQFVSNIEDTVLKYLQWDSIEDTNVGHKALCLVCTCWSQYEINRE